MNNIKKSYQAPRLTVHGNATELTQATQNGNKFDRALGTAVTPAVIAQGLLQFTS